MHARRHEGPVPVATSAKVEESGGCRDGWERGRDHRGRGSHTCSTSVLYREQKLCVDGGVDRVLCPQTILFSSKAILFDILSSKTELRTATVQTGAHWDSKYDQQHCKGYVFWSVPGWHLLLSFGTLQGCRIHKGPPLWEQNKFIKKNNHRNDLWIAVPVTLVDLGKC